MTGGSLCDADRVRSTTSRITGVLERRAAPAAALVTPGRACIGPALLRATLERWREIGATLGNHTATHPDLNDTPIDDYLANLDRGQRLIEEAAGAGSRWFRPPYLHSGADTAKRRALAEHLASRGYRVAPVTVDNQEWVYAAVYEVALERGDELLADRVVAGYLEHLESSMEFYEAVSRSVFDREIPQVLLLHANALNADHLDAVLTMLEERGYRFVGLAEAVSDPAYDRPDTYVGPRGLSWLQRWALASGVNVPPEPREAEWVAEALRRSRSGGLD